MFGWMESHLLLLGVGVFALVAAVAVWRGVFAGYGQRLFEPSVLSAKEQAILSACADALFPHGGPLPLSGTEAGVLPFFDSMLRQLPKQNRLLIRALLLLLEHGPWVVNRRARLTRQAPEVRVDTLRSWSESRHYLLRTAFIGIRALLTMAYLENHDVATRVGHLPNRDPFARTVTA